MARAHCTGPKPCLASSRVRKSSANICRDTDVMPMPSGGSPPGSALNGVLKAKKKVAGGALNIGQSCYGYHSHHPFRRGNSGGGAQGLLAAVKRKSGDGTPTGIASDAEGPEQAWVRGGVQRTAREGGQDGAGVARRGSRGSFSSGANDAGSSLNREAERRNGCMAAQSLGRRCIV